jgi:hypothetical protein
MSGHLRTTRIKVLTLLPHWNGIFASIYQFYSMKSIEDVLSVVGPRK